MQHETDHRDLDHVSVRLAVRLWSLLSRRQRPSQAEVRSTILRFGKATETLIEAGRKVACRIQPKASWAQLGNFRGS